MREQVQDRNVCLLQRLSLFLCRAISHPKQLSGEPGGEGVPAGRERTQSFEDEDEIRRAYGLKR